MGNLLCNSKKLIIMRGLPGSGKSTLARQLADDKGVIHSTDDYFITDGVFTYESYKIKDAHIWNQNRTNDAMIKGTKLIIIDNCNVRKWEAKKYVELAKQYDYEVQFVEANTPWARDVYECSKRNTHGVPRPVIDRMNAEWDDNFTVESVLESKAPWEKN